MIENISVTSLLTEFVIYSDYPLPASFDHLGFFLEVFPAITSRARSWGPFISNVGMHSSARNPHYDIKLQKSCPQGHNVLPTKSLSGQAVLRDRNGHVEGTF